MTNNYYTVNYQGHMTTKELSKAIANGDSVFDLGYDEPFKVNIGMELDSDGFMDYTGETFTVEAVSYITDGKMTLKDAMMLLDMSM